MSEKNTPEIHFEGFDKEWQESTLDSLTEIIGGGTPDTSNPAYWDGDIDWYSPAEIGDKIFVNGSRRRITSSGVANSSARILPAGRTILFTSRASIGLVAILSKSACTNQGFQSLVLEDNCDPYFFYSMGSKLKQKALTLASGSTFLEISGKQLGTINVRVPPLEEQQAIGSYFRELDTLLEAGEKKLEKLRHLKQTMLLKMFPQGDALVPEVRFTKFTGNWECSKLGDLGSTFSGLSGKSKGDFGHGEAHYVTYLNVNLNATTSVDGLGKIEIDTRQTTVSPGDILFTTSSEVPDEVGMSSVVEEIPANTYLNSFCFGYRPHAAIQTNFWAYMLRVPYVREQFTLLAQGISRFNISKTRAMDISVLLPEKAEQQAIGAYFRELDTLLEAEAEKLVKLRHLKSAFLRQMFV